jgi:hypothetical protein
VAVKEAVAQVVMAEVVQAAVALEEIRAAVVALAVVHPEEGKPLEAAVPAKEAEVANTLCIS